MKKKKGDASATNPEWDQLMAAFQKAIESRPRDVVKNGRRHPIAIWHTPPYYVGDKAPLDGRESISEREEEVLNYYSLMRLETLAIQTLAKTIMRSRTAGRFTVTIQQREQYHATQPDRPPVELPPGMKMTEWAAIVFSRKTVERVFQPMVADFQKEHIEALAAGAPKAVMRGIALRYWSSYAMAFLYEACSQIGKLVKAIRGAG